MANIYYPSYLIVNHVKKEIIVAGRGFNIPKLVEFSTHESYEAFILSELEGEYFAYSKFNRRMFAEEICNMIEHTIGFVDNECYIEPDFPKEYYHYKVKGRIVSPNIADLCKREGIEKGSVICTHTFL
jgi:hypothetical protein